MVLTRVFTWKLKPKYVWYVAETIRAILKQHMINFVFHASLFNSPALLLYNFSSTRALPNHCVASSSLKKKQNQLVTFSIFKKIRYPHTLKATAVRTAEPGRRGLSLVAD